MLSQTCKYALRAITYVVDHLDEGPALAKDIAEEADVPLRYLQKIMRDLVRSGVLHSTRGIGGGFRLSKPPERIHLIDVLAPFDDSLQKTMCPFGNIECGVRNLCPVHERWSEVVEAYRNFLDTTTLAHLAGHKPGKPKARRKSPKRR